MHPPRGQPKYRTSPFTRLPQYAFEVRAVNDAGGGDPAAATATPKQHPNVIVRPEQASYRFAEDAGNPGVAFVAQVEPGGERPFQAFAVAVFSGAVPGGATPPEDHAALAVTVAFQPDDYSEVGGVWQTRKTVALDIRDDSVDEDDEDFRVELRTAPFLPSWVHVREADGVTACDADGCSATVTIEDNDSAPSAPQNLAATPGDGAVILAWAAPADPGTSAVTGYEYRHAAGTSVPAQTAWQSAGTDLSVTVGSLVNGTEYAFEVRAVSDAGDGDPAATTATPVTVPVAPQSVSATPADGQVTLTWEAPADDGGSAVTGYEYRHAQGGTVPAQTAWQSAGTSLTATVGSLANGTEYAFEVRAVNDVGEGDAAAVTATPATVPVAPQNVSATPADGQVTLTWEAPADDGGSAVTGYEYRHAQGGTVPAQTAWQSAGTDLTVTIGSLANGTEYAFEVRAVNDAGEGDAAAVTATPSATAVRPTPPRNLAATPADGAVTLTWNVPANNGGAPISGYEYRYAEGATIPGATGWAFAGTGLSVTVGSLANGTEYAFEVRVANNRGVSNAAAVTATPAQPAVSSAPQTLEAAAGDRAVTLTWQAPADEGSSAVTGYEYRHAQGDTVPAQTAWQSAGTDLTVTIASLTNGTEYAFEVRAVNTVGEGDAATTTATPATVPGAPRNLAATPKENRVSLRWEAPTSDGGSAVTGYEYRHAQGGTVPAQTAWQSAGTDLSVTIGSLVNGTQYAFEVRAVNDAGGGDPAAATATPKQHPNVIVRPEQASYRFAEDAGNPGVAFVAQVEPGGERPFQEFEVAVFSEAVPDGATSREDYAALAVEVVFHPDDYSVVGGVWQARNTVALDIRDDSADEDDEDFRVELGTAPSLPSWVHLREADGVTACDADGCSTTVTIEDNDSAPSAPRNLAATPGDGAVILAWAAPADPGTSAVTGYEYRHAAGTSVPAQTAWQSAGTDLSVTVGSLVNGTEYAFEVRAVSDAGDGDPAATTATPVTVPVAPQSVSATPGDGQVTLTWEAPADDGGSAVTGYEYRHAQGGTVPAQTAWQSAGTSLTATVGSLANGTQYAFEVRAVNDVGEGDAAAVTATPAVQPTAPSAPQNLVATSADGQVVLVWEAPASNGGSAVTGYEYRHAEGTSVPAETAWQSAGTSLTATVGSLANGTQYAFEIRAVNAAGEGDAAAVTAMPAVQPTAPSAPQNLVAVPDDREVVLTWAAPASDGGSAIAIYEYRHAEGETVPEETAWISTGLALTAKVGGLDNGSEYVFEVRAVNDVGPGDAVTGTAVPKKPLDTVTVPGPPRNLSVVLGDGAATISWEPPESDGGAEIDEYRYRFAEGGTVPAQTAWQSAGTNLTATVEGLADGAVHTFQVRAVNGTGPGGWSETAVTVLELPLLSAENSRAEERTDDAIGFTVELSRSSTRVVSVDYATADGSAKAGEDYERTVGTLVFPAGVTEQTVLVRLLRDAKDEAEETFAFTLSNARNARIETPRVTGTIANDGDPLPGAWLVRHARTVAQQVVDAVGNRLEGSPRRHATISGVPVPDGAAGAGPGANATPLLEPQPLPGDERGDHLQRGLGILSGSSFHLSSSEPAEGPVLSFWGRVAADGFDAHVEDVRMDGNVTTGLLAADSDWGRMTLGAAIAYSQGRGSFTYDGPGTPGRTHGKVRSTFMGIYPYARVRLDETASLWGLAGTGTGRFTFTEEGGPSIRADTTLTLGALGGVKTLFAAPDTGGFALSLRSDAFWVRTTSEAVRSVADGNLERSQGEVSRVRFALQGERSFSAGEGRTLVPSFSIGVRHDGGDAETGLGVEVGAGIDWTDTSRGISAELDTRHLVTHEARGFRDWGVSGSLRFDRDPSSDRGLALSLTSSAGAAATSGTDSLLSAASVSEFSQRNTPGSSGRLTAEAAYGMPAMGGRLTGVPFVGIGLSGSGRDYTLGWRSGRTAPTGQGDLGLSFTVTRSEHERGGAEFGAAVTLSHRW